MVIIKDNFLPYDLFVWLNDVAKTKCVESFNLATNKPNKKTKFYTDDKTGWDYAFDNLQGDLVRPQYVLGKNIEIIHNKILNELQNNNIQPLSLDSVFFMFATTGYTIQKHTDIRYVSSSDNQLQKIVKAFIFCHENWNDDWGGELCFNSGDYLPLANRLLIYTADELHWVNKVNNIHNNHRMIFGIRFGDELNYE